MNYFEAIILGIIQGATEFLPISSSGHLLLVPSLFNLSTPTLPLIAIVHEGTLLAVLIYFRKDILSILKGVWTGLLKRQSMANHEARLGWFILVGSIPAALAGLTLENFFDEIFGTPIMAAIFLLGTALLLVVGEKLVSGQKDIEQMNWVDALFIGLFQMLALLPGISRSGSTITAGLWRGFDRATAARYSFLLGIPAILGAGMLAMVDILNTNDLSFQLPLLAISFTSAAVTGYACIHFLLAWLRQRTLYIFAIYCSIFGLSYLLITLLGQ